LTTSDDLAKDGPGVQFRRGETGEVESIGQRLRRLRLTRGLSQRELAGPGVSYAYISRIEAGARRPSVKALRMLAPKLGVSVEYLETGSDLRDDEERELRLVDAELRLRLDDGARDAEETLHEILEEAVAAGDGVAAARARVALGLAAARQGRESDAVDHLAQATGTEFVSPVTDVNVYATLGRCYAALGAPDRAVELLEDCLAQVRQSAPDQTAALVRYTTYLSNALTDMGELERAESALQDVLDDSSMLTDPHMRVRLYWGLGRVVAHQGNAAAALDYLRRAVAMLEATEDTVQLARAHLMCAWIFISSERAEEAGTHLEVAEKLLGPNPEPIDLAYLRTEQANRAVRLGLAEEAVTRARDALDVLGDSDPHERGSAWFALAEGHALAGRTADAEDAFRRAADLLEEHGRPGEAADALKAWARLLRAEHREAEANDVLERAAALAPVGAGAARPPAS
jgi:transcriptional regulator with XRE-family HTH domain